MIIAMDKRIWPKILAVLMFGLLIGWSFFVRFYQFGKNPVGLYWDETAILLDAKTVAATGHDMHGRPWYQVLYPSYGDYKLPVYIWAAAASVKVLGATETAIRLPSAIAGLVTIIFSGMLVKELLLAFQRKKEPLFPQLAGLLTSLIVAISPWSILFSRTGFEAHLAQSLLAVSAWCFVFALRRKKISVASLALFLLSALFGILSTYTYFSVRFVWLGVFAMIGLLFINAQLDWQSFSWKKIVHSAVPMIALQMGLTLIVFLAGLWPMLHSPLYAASNTFRLSADSVLQNTGDVLQSNVDRELAGNSRLDRVVFFRWWLTFKKLAANYSDNLSLNFLFTTGDPNLRHGTGQNGLFFGSLLLFFIGGWVVLFKRSWQVGLLFLGWWILALLPASVPNTTPHALRSLNALVPLAGVIGVGLSAGVIEIWQKTKWSQVGSWLPAIGCAFLGLILIFQVAQFTHYYFFEYPTVSSKDWQGGFKELAQLTFQMRQGHEPIYVLQFDDRFNLWLLLYGPYSALQIQSFPDDSFQIRNFDEVVTEKLPAIFDQASLVVGTESQIQTLLTEHKYQVMQMQKVKVGNQVPLEVIQIQPR